MIFNAVTEFTLIERLFPVHTSYSWYAQETISLPAGDYILLFAGVGMNVSSSSASAAAATPQESGIAITGYENLVTKLSSSAYEVTVWDGPATLTIPQNTQRITRDTGYWYYYIFQRATAEEMGIT